VGGGGGGYEPSMGGGECVCVDVCVSRKGEDGGMRKEGIKVERRVRKQSAVRARWRGVKEGLRYVGEEVGKEERRSRHQESSLVGNLACTYESNGA